MMRVILVATLTLAMQAGREMPVSRLGGVGRAPTAGQTPAQPPPQPPAAQRPPTGQLPPLPVTQIDPGATAATLDSPRHFTLTFAEPRPIEEVLRLLIAGTPFSLGIDRNVDGSFHGDIKDLTLREALNTILAPLDLDFTVNGTVLRVTRRPTETRQFDINLLDVQRTLQRTAGDAVTSSVPPDDVFAAVDGGVKALLSSEGRAHIDRRAGLATVTDYPERLDRVALYLETLDVRSSREVRLEAEAFEVTLRGAPSIDWRLVRAAVGLSADAPTAGLAADPAALRAALAAQGDLRPLWTPELMALNNEPALMRVSTPGESSLTLAIVPQISSGGIVQLSVSHTWEEHAGEQKSGFMKSTPISRVAEADIVARVASGRTVVLTGWLRPVEVGKSGRGPSLFGGSSKEQGHAELVVLVTPTIVTPGTR